MKMQDALNEIHAPCGYMVHFEWWGDGLLRSDHFPDKGAGEPLIETEDEAWDLAERFSEATKGRTCDLYVVRDDYTPVVGYKDRRITNR